MPPAPPPPALPPPAPKSLAPVAPPAPAAGCCGSAVFMQQMEMLQKMLQETQEKSFNVSSPEPLDVMQQLAQQAQLQLQQEQVPSQRKEEPLPTPMVKAQAPDPPNLEPQPPPPVEAPPPVSQARSRSRDGPAGRKKSSSSSSSPSRKRSPSRRRRSRRRSRSRRDSRRRSPSRRRDSRARRSRSGRRFSQRSRSRRSRSNRYRRPERPRSPPRRGDRAPRFNDMTTARREECGDFKRGKCTRGDRCRFAHVDGGGGKGSGGSGGAAARPELRGAENGERPGDWKCPNCAVMVFASKNECFKCHTRKDGTKGTGMEGSGPPPEKYSEALWEKPRQQIGLKLVGELSNSAWQYVLSDESRRCFAAYLSCPFSQEQTKQYFNVIKDGTHWKQPEGPNGPIPRKTAWMVASNGCQCTYRYGRIEVDPTPFPPWMMSMMASIMPMCGFPDPNFWPNSCNLNLYEDGGMSVGWHSDDESLFQGKLVDIRILSLSLGARRKFELRANWPDEPEHPKSVMLSDGDMMTMEGMTQKHFQHRVPKEGYVDGPRINLTWRWTVRHTPRCPLNRRR